MKRFIIVAMLMLSATLVAGCRSNIHTDLTVVASLVIGLIVMLFLVLAHYSNILRDEVSDLDLFHENAQKIEQNGRRRLVNRNYPFSLSKVQFGLWTVIIASSYIYLSLFKGDCAAGPINKTALVLMGIFAGTAVATTIMDKREINDNRTRHQNSPSQGFFIDILSDDNGISLHRFQNFVWTLIAMTIYLYKVSLIRTGCVLPELSDTLLALTGISNVTFLLLRSKENATSPEIVPQVSTANTASKVAPVQGVSSATGVAPKEQLVPQ
jgi:hypothetical protein